MPGQAMQDFSWEAIDAWVLSAYRDLMQKYLKDRALIDPKNLVEIRYEELDAHPMETLESIYSSLDLPDFSITASRAQSYLDGLGVFEKNDFAYPDDVVRTVNEHWGFAFDAFGYERLEPGVAPEGPASNSGDVRSQEVGR